MTSKDLICFRKMCCQINQARFIVCAENIKKVNFFTYDAVRSNEHNRRTWRYVKYFNPYKWKGNTYLVWSSTCLRGRVIRQHRPFQPMVLVDFNKFIGNVASMDHCSTPLLYKGQDATRLFHAQLHNSAKCVIRSLPVTHQLVACRIPRMTCHVIRGVLRAISR
jgi:hypothetical protein